MSISSTARPGMAYWHDIFVPASAAARSGGNHLCVVFSDEAANQGTGLVALTMAARPERKRTPIDVYRIRLDPDDFVPAEGMAPLDQTRSLGLESLQSVPVTSLPKQAGTVAFANFSTEHASEFRSVAAAIRVQFQLPGYLDCLKAMRGVGRPFEPSGSLRRGDVVRCRIGRRARVGVIVSNDRANALETCTTIQVLALAAHREEGWTIPVERVRRQEVKADLKVLLKKPHESADHVAEQVTELSDNDRSSVDGLLMRMFSELLAA